MTALEHDVDPALTSAETVDPSSAEVAAALGRLPALDPELRTYQRSSLEATAAQLYPPPGAAGPASDLTWPQALGLLIVVAAGLIAVVGLMGRLSAAGRSAPATPSLPPAAVPLPGGRSVPVLGTVVSAGLPVPGGSPQLPAGRPGGPAVPARQSATGDAAQGSQASLATLTPGTGAVPTRGSIPSPTPLHPPTPSVVVRVSPLIPPAPRLATVPSVSVRVGCPPSDAPPVPAGPGPWLVGRVLDSACRPVPNSVVLFEAEGSGVEFLGRTEPDGSYAIAVEPGTYRVDLVGVELWQAISPGASGRPVPVDPALTVTDVNDVGRLDLLTQGGER